MSNLYSLRSGLHISSSRIGRPILGIYKSLTNAWKWKLGLRPRYSFSGNICFKISVFCLCSAVSTIVLHVYLEAVPMTRGCLASSSVSSASSSIWLVSSSLARSIVTKGPKSSAVAWIKKKYFDIINKKCNFHYHIYLSHRWFECIILRLQTIEGAKNLILLKVFFTFRQVHIRLSRNIWGRLNQHCYFIVCFTQGKHFISCW